MSRNNIGNNESGFNFDTFKTLQIGVEVCAILGIGFYFHKKNTELTTELSELKKQVEEQTKALIAHENAIKQLVQFIQYQNPQILHDNSQQPKRQKSKRVDGDDQEESQRVRENFVGKSMSGNIPLKQKERTEKSVSFKHPSSMRDNEKPQTGVYSRENLKISDNESDDDEVARELHRTEMESKKKVHKRSDSTKRSGNFRQ